jgi:hypothetical protein
MPSSLECIDPTKFQEKPATFQSKTIFVEKIFQDISK